MEEISNREQFNKALEEDYVMIDCTASWCGPCKRIKPKIEELSKNEKYNDISFYIYDIDNDDELSQEYVTVVPTFLFFKDGELVKKLEGADYNNIVKQLDILITQSESDSNSDSDTDSDN